VGPEINSGYMGPPYVRNDANGASDLHQTDGGVRLYPFIESLPLLTSRYACNKVAYAMSASLLQFNTTGNILLHKSCDFR
jgi:hypothetical protein